MKTAKKIKPVKKSKIILRQGIFMYKNNGRISKELKMSWHEPVALSNLIDGYCYPRIDTIEEIDYCI